MVGVSFVGILFLLMIFGACAVVVGLIVLAAAKGRPGLAALIAGLAIVVPIVLGTFAALFVSYTVRSTPMSENDWHMEVSPGGPQLSHQQTPSHIAIDGVAIDGDGTSSIPQFTFSGTPPAAPFSQAHWKVSFVSVLFILFGGLALFALVVRRSFGHAAAGGHGRIWPAFLALPILAIFFFGSFRYQRSSSWDSQQQAARSVERVQQQKYQHQQQHQQHQQQIAFANKMAEATKQLQYQIEHMDIQELMDKFDAPRIALQSPMGPPAAPVVLAIAAVSQAETQPAELPEAKPQQKSTAKASNKRPPKMPILEEEPDAAVVKKVESVAVAKYVPAVIANAEKSARTKPAWIDDPPKRTGNVRREVIATDEYATADECYQAADVYLLFKTYNHVRELQGLPYQEGHLPSVSFQNGMILADGQPVATGRQNPQWIDARARYLSDLGVGLDYIRREIVAKDPKDNESCEYLESVDRFVGPMKKLYMQMAFTPDIDRGLMENLSAYARQGRIGMVGTGAASVLALLTMVWGLLKVDTATKGYYSKWLFIGVPLAIIGGASLLWVDPLHMF